MFEQESQIPNPEANTVGDDFFSRLEELITTNRTHHEKSTGRMSTRIHKKKLKTGAQTYTFDELSGQGSKRRTYRLKVRRDFVRVGESSGVSLYDLGLNLTIEGGYTVVIKNPTDEITDAIKREVWMDAGQESLVIYDSSAESEITKHTAQMMNNIFTTISQTYLNGVSQTPAPDDVEGAGS